MSKATGRIMVAMVLVSNWFYPGKAKARPQIAYGQPACESCVPGGWGE